MGTCTAAGGTLCQHVLGGVSSSWWEAAPFVYCGHIG